VKKDQLLNELADLDPNRDYADRAPSATDALLMSVMASPRSTAQSVAATAPARQQVITLTDVRPRRRPFQWRTALFPVAITAAAGLIVGAGALGVYALHNPPPAFAAFATAVQQSLAAVDNVDGQTRPGRWSQTWLDGVGTQMWLDRVETSPDGRRGQTLPHAYVMRPSDMSNPDAVGVELPTGDPSWWLTPEGLAYLTRWDPSQEVTVVDWSWSTNSTLGVSTFTARIRVGEGRHALLATGRLGWEDGQPVLRDSAWFTPSIGAEVEYADTPRGRELRAENQLAATPMELPVGYAVPADGEAPAFVFETITPDESRLREGSAPFWACGLAVEFAEPWTLGDEHSTEFIGHVQLCSDASSDVVTQWREAGLDQQTVTLTLEPLPTE